MRVLAGRDCGAQPRSRDEGLQAAPVAARASGAVVLHGYVADLAGGEALAEILLAVEDYPGAHAGADLDDHQVVVDRSVGVFGQRGGVGVVGDPHRETEPVM